MKRYGLWALGLLGFLEAANAQEHAAARAIKDGASSVFDIFLTTWKLNLFSVGDRSITVSNLVIAAMIFALGLFLAKHASRIFRRRLLAKFNLVEGEAAAIQTLTYYIFLTFVTLFSLNMANIPLTIFTFLGGAIALGVGFGSQNILNNFISGIIMLLERPIKVGDLVSVDGTFGSIERIGARSTRVKAINNTHIIVPNSSFIEKNVLNWTHSDFRIRTELSVGVKYGSDTALVRDLLVQVIDDHPHVLTFPKPEILFSDFGNSSLDFTALFWIEVRQGIERRRIESDIRFKVDAAFREHGVTIPFPQRDVHFFPQEALSVKHVESGLGEKLEAGQDGQPQEI